MKKPFKVSPRILSHLGEGLIKNETIALLELVKNSYDANAKNCFVHFKFENEHLSTIDIIDDGTGMDRETIENNWLTVGTDNKAKQIEKNTKGRIPLGEKGIGRLGVHKLGNTISLITKAIDSPGIRVDIDWSLLEEAVNIEDFLVGIAETDEFENSLLLADTGTLIRIGALKTEWTKTQLRNVYRQLNSLNSPFGRNDLSDAFKVEITSNLANVFEGLPSFEDIKAGAMYFGECVLRGNKIVKIEYDFRPWPSLVKIENGRSKRTKDFLPNELNLVDSTKKNNPIDLSQFKIGDIQLELMIFEKELSIFAYVEGEKTSINEYLKINGGIRVYRDRMRVFNYGEPDDDWLGLNQKRVTQLGGRISSANAIGAVFLNRLSSADLVEKTNREGFVENEAYRLFVEAINYAVELIVKERNIDKEILSTLYKKSKNIEPVLSDLEEVIVLVEEKVQDEKSKEEILNYLYRINTQYRDVKGILLKSANIGLNFSIVIHELDKLMSTLKKSIADRDIKKASELSKSLEAIIQGFSSILKSSKITNAPLAAVVKQAIDNYRFRFKDHKIQIVTNYQSSTLRANYSISEAISILINLLDNSIYWLSYQETRKNRMIGIMVTDEIKPYVSIIVMDNGPGFNIPQDIAIKPFVTGKPHNIGSGLGLHIADQIMQSMGGQLVFPTFKDIGVPDEFKNITTGAVVALCFKTTT